MNNTQSTALKQPLIAVPYRIILALVYTASVLVTSKDLIDAKLTTLDQEQLPLSLEATSVLMRFSVIGFVLFATFVQGAVLAFLFSLITSAPQPKAGESWSFVLAGQMPLAMTTFVVFLIGHAQGLSILREPFIQHPFAAVSMIIFAILACQGKDVDRKRLIAFTVVAVAINAAMVLLARQVIV